MPNLNNDIASLIAAHGAAAVSSAVASHAAQASALNPSKAAGAYITSIITGDQAFDEGVLHRVSNVLAQGAQAGLGKKSGG